MASSNSKTSFSSLPLELRIDIFRYVLPQGEDISPKFRVSRRGTEQNFPARDLLVCKLFNNEATPVLYSENKFSFFSLCDAMIYFRRIGRINSSYIKDLVIWGFSLARNEAYYLDMEYDEAGELVADEFTKRLPSLTSLVVLGVRQDGNLSKWAVKTLEIYQPLISKSPRLPSVYYSAPERMLCLRTKALVEYERLRLGYRVFDVEGLIRTTKDEIKAARSAGAKRAVVTRAARKAQAAS